MDEHEVILNNRIELTEVETSTGVGTLFSFCSSVAKQGPAGPFETSISFLESSFTSSATFRLHFFDLPFSPKFPFSIVSSSILLFFAPEV